jgi:hypothetical protein
VTAETGIRRLVPAADIDDYVFEPCGYSMNGITGPGFMTIHITPEAGFSYASVEVSGFDPAAYDPADMVSRILAIFRPGMASVSLSVDAATPSGEYGWGALAGRPRGYACASATCQELASGGRVSYYTFSPAAGAGASALAHADAVAVAAAPAAAAKPKAAAAAGARAAPPLRPRSPAALLRHMPSFSSLPSLDSDGEDAAGSSSKGGARSGGTFSSGASSSSGDEGSGADGVASLAAALQRLARANSANSASSGGGGSGSRRNSSGSLSPKSVRIMAPRDAVPCTPGACAPNDDACALGGGAALHACAACKGSGVAPPAPAAAVKAAAAALVARQQQQQEAAARGGAATPQGSASPASPVSPVRLTA